MNHSILFLLPCFSGGGAERVILNLAIGLHNRGYSIGIIVFNLEGPLISMIPVELPIYNLGTRSLLKSIIPLVRKIRQLQPKIIFSTFGYINVALLSIRKVMPRKTKIWIREANLPSISLPNNLYPRLMVFLYQHLYKNADKVFCTSLKMKNEFLNDFLISSSLISILPNPVDVEKILVNSKSVKRFDIGGICYIASGRLKFQKGFDHLLKWFAEIEDSQATLVILGDGPLRDILREQTFSLDVQNRVKFLGFCDNPWEWYAGADVFLLSSRWEGLPNVVLESLAAGTPAIVTAKSGGVKEIFDQKINDNIIIAEDKKQFINAMKVTKIKNQNKQYSSLLPKKFEMNNVIKLLEGWLDV
jgi:glycosyltransferase involved in cell wall biosynthesis